MKHLILIEESTELAKKYVADFKSKKWQMPIDNQDIYHNTQVDFMAGIEAANSKFEKDYAPVLEKCNAILKVSKIIIESVSEEFPIMAKNLNFKHVLEEIESSLTNLKNLIK